MTITAKVIADSMSPDGIRITTMELMYPRFIHSEFMTHRVFSRNASSSRAIPIMKMIKAIRADMAMPIVWGSNQPGMQAGEQLTPWRKFAAKTLWKLSGHIACSISAMLFRVGAHKQIANRITEPFAHIKVVVTATEWRNFMNLRDHKDAQPEIRMLARQIKVAMRDSDPKKLKYGEWHLPYADRPLDLELAKAYLTNNGVLRKEPLENELRDTLIKLSVARCASVSYKTVDGKEMTFARAISLYEKLVAGEPLHASPTEHQAAPDGQYDEAVLDGFGNWVGDEKLWCDPELHGNLNGWIQFRKTLDHENTEGHITQVIL